MDANAAASETVAQDRELFALVAQTHPGVVRTLNVRIGEQGQIDLDHELPQRLGEHIRRVGETVITRSGPIVIDRTPKTSRTSTASIASWT